MNQNESEKARDMTLSEIENLLGFKINLVKTKEILAKDLVYGDIFQDKLGRRWVVLENADNCIKSLALEAYEISRWRKPNNPTNRHFFTNEYRGSVAFLICDKLKTLMNNKDCGLYHSYPSDIRYLDGTFCDRIGMAVRLLTFDEAREYIDLLNQYRIEKNWWLASARRKNIERDECDDIMMVSECGDSVEIDKEFAWKELAIRPVAIFSHNATVIVGE